MKTLKPAILSLGLTALVCGCTAIEREQSYAADTNPTVLTPFYATSQPPPGSGPLDQNPVIHSSPVSIAPTPTPTPASRPVISSKPKPTPKPKPKEESIAFGVPVAGKPGFVTSPYSPDAGYIDVQGFAPGSLAKDPYTNKVFKVP